MQMSGEGCTDLRELKTTTLIIVSYMVPVYSLVLPTTRVYDSFDSVPYHWPQSSEKMYSLVKELVVFTIYSTTNGEN